MVKMSSDEWFVFGYGTQNIPAARARPFNRGRQVARNEGREIPGQDQQEMAGCERRNFFILATRRTVL